jgi:Flp pilus assembly protein CpaB
LRPFAPVSREQAWKEGIVDVPQARRAAKPSWVNARTVLGILLFSIAFLGAQRVLSQARTTVDVWAAAHDLGAGTTLRAEDVLVAGVKLPGELLPRYVLASGTLEGASLNQAVRAGELIPAASVRNSDVEAVGRSMTIPVTPEHANGGALRPGDRIDVFATFNPGDLRARTALLVGDVEVLGVVTAGGLVGGDVSAVGVTVAVSPEDAARVAYAIRNAELDIARITGTAVTEPGRSIGIEDFE